MAWVLWALDTPAHTRTSQHDTLRGVFTRLDGTARWLTAGWEVLGSQETRYIGGARESICDGGGAVDGKTSRSTASYG